MKYRVTFFALLTLALASCSSERSPTPRPASQEASHEQEALTLRLGMNREAAVGIIGGCDGQDITANLAVVGPHGEWPLSGLFWDLDQYDSVLEITAEGGKVNGIGYWIHADFSKSKSHRSASRRSLKSLTFDKQSKTVKIEVL